MTRLATATFVAGCILATGAQAYEVICQDSYLVLHCNNGDIVPCTNGDYQIDCSEDLDSPAYLDACGEGGISHIGYDNEAIATCKGDKVDDPITVLEQTSDGKSALYVDCGDGEWIACDDARDCADAASECSSTR